MKKEEAQRETASASTLLDPPQTLAAGALVCLARELEADLGALVAATFERLRRALPGWMAETVFSNEEITRFVRASLRLELQSFRRGSLPESCPPVDAAGARAIAKLGELKLLLSGYRLAQAVLWEAWFERVEDYSAEAAVRNELLRYGSQYFHLYADLLVDFVTDVYQREFEQSVRSGEQRRLHSVRSLLEGRPLIDSQLDLDLDQHHLALIASGPGAEDAARALAAALDRRLFLVGPLNQSWWGWLSGTQPLGRAAERRLRGFAPPAGVRVSLGLEGFGEAGFRASNRQALRARVVCPDREQQLVNYADVAVEALVSENLAEARAFLAHELRGIDDDTATSEKIRETIAAYFAAEHNAASAGAALGVHQQTVANRLRAAEERLGHPVAARRLELETALRLRACLEAEPQ